LTSDSDLNAACNHEIDLIEIPIWVWKGQFNRQSGFYWLGDKIVICQELIVLDTEKNKL